MSRKRRKPFWTSLPGFLAGLAALITSVTGLYLALDDRSKNGSETSSDVAVTETIQTNHRSSTLASRIKAAADQGSKFWRWYQNDSAYAILQMIDCPFYLNGEFLYTLERLRESFERGARPIPLDRVSHPYLVKPLDQLIREDTASQRADNRGRKIISIARLLALRDTDIVLYFSATRKSTFGSTGTTKSTSNTIWLFTRLTNEGLVIVGLASNFPRVSRDVRFLTSFRAIE